MTIGLKNDVEKILPSVEFEVFAHEHEALLLTRLKSFGLFNAEFENARNALIETTMSSEWNIISKPRYSIINYEIFI